MQSRHNLPGRDDERPYHAIGAYKAWRLANAVNFPVDQIWICGAGRSAAYRHRILPLGEPSIAVRRRRSRDGSVSDATIVICGPYSRPFWHLSAADEEMIAIRLKPEFASHMLDIEPAAFQDEEPIEPAPAFARALTKTRAVIASACPLTLAEAMIEDISQITNGDNTSARDEHFAAMELRAANGRTPIREIAASLSISERQLRRRFHDAVGCSPKDYARRLRVAKAAILADAEPNPNWAFIAAETGFHDQAHMITSFKALSGLTPRALHRERRGNEG